MAFEQSVFQYVPLTFPKIKCTLFKGNMEKTAIRQPSEFDFRPHKTQMIIQRIAVTKKNTLFISFKACQHRIDIHTPECLLEYENVGNNAIYIMMICNPDC